MTHFHITHLQQLVIVQYAKLHPNIPSLNAISLKQSHLINIPFIQGLGSSPFRERLGSNRLPAMRPRLIQFNIIQ